MWGLVILSLVVFSAAGEEEQQQCFVKWVQGYKLATGRPQKIIRNIDVNKCMVECSSTPGCAALAFGDETSTNGTICELAIRSEGRTKGVNRFFRNGRSMNTTERNTTISINDLDRSPKYDVYVENPNSNEPCYKREPLYESNYSPNSLQQNNGVPIDCFYRLMSGKRLVKTQTLRAISVNSLQECQEACIHERSFNCRSISYRYMPSIGYSYPVSNCEMSSYYMQSSAANSYSKYDFNEDYDYDFFQRETHCKTTSSNHLGVCAVVVRRGGRVSTNLIKSSHHTITSSQCEHLCATSLFRCRAFAFRHTSRGRDPYNRVYPSSSDLPPSEHSCLLYDTDLMRLPSYNIEVDQDFDLFEMGRLITSECVLYEQFINRRPGYYNPGPVTSTLAPYDPESRDTRFHSYDRDVYHREPNREYMRDPSYNRDREYFGNAFNRGKPNREHEHSRDSTNRGKPFREPSRDAFNREPSRDTFNREPPRDTPFREPASVFDREQTRVTDVDYNREKPVDYNREGDYNMLPENNRELPPRDQASHGTNFLIRDGNATVDGSSSSCLKVFRQDAYLMNQVSRATFPVKTVDECKVECLRSLNVLRFACRGAAFRHTSQSMDNRGGGSCQLSDQEPRDNDLVVARDRFEQAVTFVHDDREPSCRQYSASESHNRHPGYVDYYGQNKNTYVPSYDRSYDRYYERNNDQYDNKRYGSSNYPPPNYNNHYWDYHNRGATNQQYHQRYPENQHYGSGSSYNSNYGSNYGSSNYGGSQYGGGKYAASSSSHEYHNGQGITTVNGERCLRSCRQNRDAGFYYCQIDEQGSWDFCCRPDHFCGYSKGLSVPWCYVGNGPSQNIWRSCEAKGTRNSAYQSSSSPHVAYLHDRLPPTVLSLTNNQVANLTKDNAIRLFTNNTTSVIEDAPQVDQQVIVRLTNATDNSTKSS